MIRQNDFLLCAILAFFREQRFPEKHPRPGIATGVKRCRPLPAIRLFVPSINRGTDSAYVTV